ncbi:MAG: hypothetical protein KGL39_17780 [Patescibacteria group bacterium]|nr:hypothetical protein [Patescibacteria group bacterium]
MSITWTISRNDATPALKDLAQQLTPRRMAAAVGPACARLVATHLRNLGTNKEGWPSTHFWARAARATHWDYDPQGALISISQIGVRQRWLGGEITAVNRRALTIPVSPVAYGHVAADFPGTFILKGKTGSFIAQRDQAALGHESVSGYRSRARKMGGNSNSRLRARLNILFKLVKSVLQSPNPNVLPTADELRSTALGALRMALKQKEAAPHA